MTELEDQLRSAFRAKASAISPPAPPLELQPREVAGPVVRGGGNRAWTPGRKRWLVPAAAAIAVLAVIAAALAATGALPGRRTPPAVPVQTAVPPYYVALIGSRGEQLYTYVPADVAVVRATATGSDLARIRPPRPYSFAGVTAAADDRTFVLLGVSPLRKTGGTAEFAGRTYSARLFLLRLNPAASSPSARARLTALPGVPIPRGQQLQAMALSPAGTSLAAIFSESDSVTGRQSSELMVFNLASGTYRTWTRQVCPAGRCLRAAIGDGGPLVSYPSRVQLSWTADGQSLLFITGPTGSQVRLLTVSAAGHDLMADSTALPIRTAVLYWNDAVITPDGKSVFIEYGSTQGDITWCTLLRFSAATGKATIVNQFPTWKSGNGTGSGPDDVLWTNNDGSKFIVLGARPGRIKGNLVSGRIALEPSGQTAGLYDSGRYTPIAWPANVIAAAW